MSQPHLKVLVSVPTLGWIHKSVAGSLLRLQADSKGHGLKIILPTHRPFENNLHHIVNYFMDDKYDFWLSFDADNPPQRNPLDLLPLDKDIIGCPTPVWHYTDKPRERPMYLNAYDYISSEDAYKEHIPHDGLQRVDAIGTGCFLVARRVFENKAMRKAPFQRTYNDDGTVDKGNDIAFCERATKNGFEVWAHYDFMCQHFKEIELTEIRRACLSEFGEQVDT